MSAPLPSPSLRRRVTVMAVLLIGVLLLVLAVVTDVVLGDRLEGQLRQRLADRATVASALVDQVDARDLARRLEGDGVSVVVRTSGGQTYAEGPLAGGTTRVEPPTDRPAPVPPTPLTGPAAGKDVVQTGDRLSLVTRLAGGDTVTLLADAADVRRTQDQVRLALAIAAAVVLVATAVGVPLVVRRALRPLEQMTAVARSITAGDRERRLLPRSPDTDLGRAASAFDDAFDAVVGAETRAVASEERLRGFVSDAAHELRTPLAGIQVSAERVLRDEPPRAEREEAMLGLVRETRRAGRLVEDLLTMARIDQGLPVDGEPLDLHEVARDAVARDAVRHPEAEATLGDSPSLPVRGDADRLAQVLGNLLDNAHHAGTSVLVEPWADGERVGVDVVDDGPGVPLADAHRIFDRLVRLDASRARHAGGAGLGLPIARGLARAHGGDLELVDPGAAGARFRLSLPRSD
ncbi:two-component sensor histidine kinase [Marmoricola endophyticus]|uniref:histidine kinase n=1 Tax=Marmoricola endophyticus TaxID=2040280 RepID=A0A917BHM0_9ACTN|nr:HAMP domain-containing sensor histidine kinase [Marmoricola endophyticus]GGF45695.1 two-component sensor histidine kinase [Marmoricola endophyticus]